MSRTRIVLNVLLLLLLVGFLYIIGRAMLKPSTEQQISKAEQLLDEQDFATAKVRLMQLLSDNPESGEGRELMSRVLLAEAKAEGQPDTLVENEQARDHLKSAARLLPENLALQKQVLKLFFDRGALQAAAEAGEIVIKSEPDNPDALLALFAQAVEANDFAGGEARLEVLRKHPTDRVFRQLQLELRHYGSDEHPEQHAEVLATAGTRADEATVDQLLNMAFLEQLLIPSILQEAIAKAPDVETAQQRASVALGVCEKIVSSGLSDPAELAEFAAGSMRVLRRNHPLDPTTPELQRDRRELEKRADVFIQKAIDKGSADAAIYHEAALMAFNRRDHEQAEWTLKSAVSALQDLPADRRRELSALQLLAARNLIVMRRYGDAKPYLKALMESGDRNFAGWAALLAGRVASAEGRDQLALERYLTAQQKLGQTPLVSMALASAYLKRKQWEPALQMLKFLENVVDSTDVEQQAWAQTYEMLAEQLQWNQFRAHLALDQWDQAQPQMIVLRGTRMEPKMEATATLYLAAKNESDAALARLEKARQRFPNDLRLLHTHVLLLARAGKGEEAIQIIEQLAGREDLASQIYLVKWRLRQNKPDQALEILTALESRHPDNLYPRMLKARVLLALGKTEEALEISQQLRDSPQTAAAGDMLELSQFLSENKFDEATEKLQQIAEDAPSVTPRMNLLAGNLAAAKGDFENAIEQVGETLDVTGLRGQSRKTLLKSLLLMAVREGPEKAAAKLAPLLERYPDDALLRLAEADLHFKQGKFDTGLQALDRVESLLPGRPTAPYLKAAVWAQAGNADKAIAETNRALAMDQRYFDAQALAARLNLAINKYPQAVDHARRALALNPRSWQLYLVLAEALQRANRRSQAIEVLEQAIAAEPRFLAAYRGLASLQLAAGKTERAQETLQKAQSVAPDAFILVLDEIAILAQRKQVAEAEQLAQEAVGEPPDVAKSLAVAGTMSGVGERDIARKWATSTMELADESQQPPIHLLLGEIALLEAQASGDREKFEEARDHFAEVVKVQPNHFVAGNNLAWLLATEFGQPEEALSIAQVVRGDAPVEQLPVGFIDTLAVVYRVAGELDKAKEMLEQSVSMYPQSGPLAFHLGMVLADSGQTSAAVSNLERALQLGGLTDDQTSAAREAIASVSRLTQ